MQTSNEISTANIQWRNGDVSFDSMYPAASIEN
jgi:hypothetical protein